MQVPGFEPGLLAFFQSPQDFLKATMEGQNPNQLDYTCPIYLPSVMIDTKIDFSVHRAGPDCLSFFSYSLTVPSFSIIFMAAS